jgi:NADH-quinone oxidoreductase subunit J
MIDIVFAFLSLTAIGGGLGMIVLAQPIYSAFSLIVSMVAIAGIFALLSSPFLFAVQIIIYAGAIITLLLFVIMFLNIKNENLPQEPNKFNIIIVGAILLVPFNILIIKAFNTLPHKSMKILSTDFGSVQVFGMELFRSWLIPFELISMLLLSALVGAVVYARKEKSNG